MRVLCVLMILVCTAGIAGAAEWHVRMSSLWGGSSKSDITAVAMDAQGVAYVGAGAYHSVAGVPRWQVADSSRGGVLLAIDSALGEVIWVADVPITPRGMLMTSDEHLMLIGSGQVLKIDLDEQVLLWQVRAAGDRLVCDGYGGAWTYTGRQATHLSADGEQLRSLSIRGADLAVDPQGERLFTCGFNSGRSTIKERNPVHVPWVRAFDYEGNQLWQMWGFTPTEVDEVGDMADSHPQRLYFSPNGHLYMFGDSDGGNTPYRHSPHEPGASHPEGTLSGTPFREMWRAFRSVRMLFVCRINPENGDVLRGSFFYGLWFNEERNRQEVGDAQAMGLHVDENDRVYLTGVMRAAPPWTSTAVHQQAAPVDRRGYWNNHVATDEAYVAVMDQDFTRLAFCSGFNQNGSPRAWSRGLAVAANGDGLVMAGTVRENNDYAPSELNYLLAPLQDSWSGGGEIGYFTVLHRGRFNDHPLEHLQHTVTHIYGDDHELLQEFASIDHLTPFMDSLEASDEPFAETLSQLLARLSGQALQRAVVTIAADPYDALQRFQVIQSTWRDHDVGEAASTQIEAMRNDPSLQTDLRAGQARDRVMAILNDLQEVPQAEEESLLDRQFARRNGRVLQRFQAAAKDMYEQFPEHQFTEQMLATAASYAVPVTEKDEEMLEYYAQMMNLKSRFRRVPGAQPSYADRRFREGNSETFREMKRILQRMQRSDARHPFTRGAQNFANRLQLPVED
ncbi:MAG: hypothetical protein EA401_05990 [Planctomycetota bacterium]|nr:MAG: hypothetical protein EA401_05990 [Planctomycetota bacterium]